MKEFIAYIFYLFVKFIDTALVLFILLSFIFTIILSIFHLSGDYIINQEIFIIMFVIGSSSIIIGVFVSNPILKLFSEKTFKKTSKLK